MAVQVVDLLEGVQVDQQQRPGLAMAAQPAGLLGQHLHQPAAVQQPGQRVELGQTLQLAHQAHHHPHGQAGVDRQVQHPAVPAAPGPARTAD
jgi:hypothetical protein